MIDAIVTGVLAVVVLTGCLFTLLGAVGLHRFPDLFSRMHAATKPATLGLVLVVLATAVDLPRSEGTFKLLLVVVLQFLTTPVGAHMVGRAAYRSGVELTDRTLLDELGRPDDAVERY